MYSLAVYDTSGVMISHFSLNFRDLTSAREFVERNIDELVHEWSAYAIVFNADGRSRKYFAEDIADGRALKLDWLEVTEA